MISWNKNRVVLFYQKRTLRGSFFYLQISPPKNKNPQYLWNNKKFLLILLTYVALFNETQVRRHWDEDQERWYFSIVDVVAILTESKSPRNYRKVLKHRLQKEWSEMVTNCNQLKMLASDGKKYLTDVADTETLLRLIQSIPSPKAEPFKLRLAKTGYERMEEMEDPELSIDRAMQYYLQKGYSKNWINQRIKTIEVRKELTDEREKRWVQKGLEYAILTNEITEARSGKSVRQYKKFKNLKKEGLRDNMSNLELILNMLAEATTTAISEKVEPETFWENQSVARQWGEIAGKTRKNIEQKTGESIISPQNAKHLQDRHNNKLQ